MDLPQIIFNHTADERKEIVYSIMNTQQRIATKIAKKHGVQLNPTQFIGLLLRATRNKFDNGLIMNMILNQIRGKINHQLNNQLMMDILTGDNLFGILLHRKQILSAEDIIQSNMFQQMIKEVMEGKEQQIDTFNDTSELLKLLLVNIKDKTALQTKYFEKQGLIDTLSKIYQTYITQQMQSKNDKQYFSTIPMQKQQIIVDTLNQKSNQFQTVMVGDNTIELSMTHAIMILLHQFKLQVNSTRLLSIIIRYHFYGQIAASNVNFIMEMFLMKNQLGNIFIKHTTQSLNDAFTTQQYMCLYEKAAYLSHDFSGKDTFNYLLTLLLARYRVNLFNLKKYNAIFQNYQYIIQYLTKGRNSQNTGNQNLMPVIEKLRKKYIDADKSIKYMYLMLLDYICENNIFDLQKVMYKHMQEDILGATDMINFGQYCDGAVTSYQQLQTTLLASRFIDSWSIYLTLNEKFQFYNINDVMQRQIFKIAYKTACMVYSEDNYFALVHKVSDGKIFKMEDPTDKFFTDLLYDLQDQLVDIVLSTKNKINVVQNFRTRYLCYQFNNYFNRMILDLKYPESLRSCAFYKVNIKNLNACQNLNHLHSNENQYGTEMINKLVNLKTFISTNDEYRPSPKKNMVNDLLENNKLEIIVINNGKNIMSSVFNKNIQNLKYLHYDGTQSIDFTMDVTQYPENIIMIQNYNGEVKFIGERDNTERIKENLLEKQNQLLIYDRVKCMKDSLSAQNKFGIFTDTSQDIKQVIIEMLRIQYCEQRDIESKYKYSILLLINYIKKLSGFEFRGEFGISSVSEAQKFVKDVKYHTISSEQQLKSYLIYVKNMEYSSLDFQFNANFTLNNVSDEQWREICASKETTSERVYSNQHFIIVRRSSDSAIFRQIGFSQEFLDQFLDDDLYDVIIVNPGDYEYIDQTALHKIKIRQLSFLCQTRRQITLEHPECILSLYIKNLQITNLAKCINLLNICSMENEYTPADIEGLTTLKRFFSQNDTFRSRNISMLQYLFNKNQLEFVHVENGRQILLENTVLNKNLTSLRYFYHSNNKFIEFTLDISNEMPTNLKVLANRCFDMILNKGQEQQPIIQGSTENIKKLRDNLLKYE